MVSDRIRRGAGSARERVTEAVRAALSAAGLDPDDHDIHLERPNDPSHGDLSCNVALVSAKQAGRKPRELAQQIVDGISFDASFMDRVEVAGPGFINFTFSRGFLYRSLPLRVSQRFCHATTTHFPPEKRRLDISSRRSVSLSALFRGSTNRLLV